MLVCGEEILDASYDDTLLCDSVITDGAVVILQKIPVSMCLIDQDTRFNFFVPQVSFYAKLSSQCLNWNLIDRHYFHSLIFSQKWIANSSG